MKKRVTCIAMLDKESLEKIERNLVGLNEYNLCKIPYLKEPYTLINREEVDTLQYHFTLSYWDEDFKEEAIKIVQSIQMEKIELMIESIEIKKGNEDSYNMYFAFSQNSSLKEIQTKIYNKTMNKKFHPDTYVSHITIHVGKEYEKISEMKNIIMRDFKKFSVSFDKLGLFEIYPAKQIL